MCVVFFLVIATMEEETTDNTMAVDVGIYVVLLVKARALFMRQIRQILRGVDQARSRQFLDFWIKVDKCRVEDLRKDENKDERAKRSPQKKTKKKKRCSVNQKQKKKRQRSVAF